MTTRNERLIKLGALARELGVSIRTVHRCRYRTHGAAGNRSFVSGTAATAAGGC